MKAEYGIGDVVVLKSSGPLLTVTSFDVGANGLVGCRWFTAQGQLAEDSFDPKTIRPFEEEDLECDCGRKSGVKSPEELLKEIGCDPGVLAQLLSETLENERRWAVRADRLARLAREKGAGATIVGEMLIS